MTFIKFNKHLNNTLTNDEVIALRDKAINTPVKPGQCSWLQLESHRTGRELLKATNPNDLRKRINYSRRHLATTIAIWLAVLTLTGAFLYFSFWSLTAMLPPLGAN